MKLLESTEEKIANSKYGENLHRLENIEVVLVHWDIVSNKYQRDSWVLATFVPNKTFSELLNISPTFVQSFYTFKYGLLIKNPNP